MRKTHGKKEDRMADSDYEYNEIYDIQEFC